MLTAVAAAVAVAVAVAEESKDLAAKNKKDQREGMMRKKRGVEKVNFDGNNCCFFFCCC